MSSWTRQIHCIALPSTYDRGRISQSICCVWETCAPFSSHLTQTTIPALSRPALSTRTRRRRVAVAVAVVAAVVVVVVAVVGGRW